jgi:hypothetical protein
MLRLFVLPGADRLSPEQIKEVSMRIGHVGRGLVVLCLALLLTTAARADRTPSSKAYYPTFPGTRPQVDVPYTTNGNSTLGVYQGVSPRIYASPSMENGNNPDVTPVFNLIFYGAKQSFGDASNGAEAGPPNQLRNK